MKQVMILMTMVLVCFMGWVIPTDDMAQDLDDAIIQESVINAAQENINRLDIHFEQRQLAMLPSYHVLKDEFEQAEACFGEQSWESAIGHYTRLLDEYSRIFDTLDSATTAWRELDCLQGLYAQEVMEMISDEERYLIDLKERLDEITNRIGVCYMNLGKVDEAIMVFSSEMKQTDSDDELLSEEVYVAMINNVEDLIAYSTDMI